MRLPIASDSLPGSREVERGGPGVGWRWMQIGMPILAGIAALTVAAGEAEAGRGKPCPEKGHFSDRGHAHGVPDHACRPKPPPPATTFLRGTAYTFNTRSTIAGAEIRIDELPDLVAVTDENGTWELEVPVGADLTPYIVAAGHHTIYLQTFHSGQDAIEEINFQTPTDVVYDLLYNLIQFYEGRPPFEDGCVIVTTVSDPLVVGMTFDEFIHFAPHGVAGATASGDPALPDPIYFNDAVIPDLGQQTSSGDGGVLWSNVPPGVYEVSATHPEVEFATFTASCVQDRVINASPPWGLHGIP
jgi:hypothetical protein